MTVAFGNWNIMQEKEYMLVFWVLLVGPELGPISNSCVGEVIEKFGYVEVEFSRSPTLSARLLPSIVKFIGGALGTV
jgi:hypothetical protein